MESYAESFTVPSAGHDLQRDVNQEGGSNTRTTQIHHCHTGMTFTILHIIRNYGRPGVAIPIGACGDVEKVGGVVEDRIPPVPIVKPATLVEPELAT